MISIDAFLCISFNNKQLTNNFPLTENPELYKEQLHLHETDKDFPGNKKS